ncbi:MAG: 2Fe-2S iron-sulfur cluster binding domain-containing protein [Treponema sp.]|nr:2Fe-2S iron-sulfur cluster binding domain-containing protein [Candidatus Treponema caballi]
MKIPFTLNGDDIVIDSEPDEKLINILRDSGNFSVKCGCNSGSCGSCTVLLNDKPVPSCLISAAAIRDCKVVTLDAFKKTPFWKDIDAGFRQSDVHLCGYCDAGKVFAAYDIIKVNRRPTKEDVIAIMKQFPCKCCETETLANSIIFAAAAHKKRTAGKQNGK